MNFAHIHLVLTHFPPVLSLGSAFSAAAGVIRRRRDLVRLALVLMVVVGAMMPLVYVAGDRAADSIGKVEGIQQDAIAPHQQAAKITLVISAFTALIAVGILIIEHRRGEVSASLRALALVAAIACALPVGWTAALGGAIHHPEISQSP